MLLEEALAKYEHIPPELKSRPNWCIAGPDKNPYKMTASGVYMASNQKPEDWTTFEKAIEGMVATNAPAIGFCLRAGEDITCIDLDVKDKDNAPDKPHLWTTPEQMQRFIKIVEVFDTYTERSSSGKGVHLWLHGTVGAGAKRDGVEVYSQERFIVCTGDVYINKPLARRDEYLEMLVTEIRASARPEQNFSLVELEPTESDEVVYQRAASAANADKFSRLFCGQWQDLYPSQSEADLALMSMFAYYSQSNEQCRRLFRFSELGKREKAVKNDRYLNYTLEIIRQRQQREAIIDAHGAELAKSLVQQLQSTTPADQMAAELVKNMPIEEVDGNIPWPPGLAGRIAHYIYSTAYRPVKEVAIVATLGFLAGVCGRAYNYSRTGLNLYIVLVAQSGIGKETMHTGISSICAALRETNPAATAFVDFNEFASGQALTKAVAINTSFVNVSGEFGRKLQRMAHDDRPDSPMSVLRTVMTNLYQKSGQGMMVGGLTYSNSEQNIQMSTGIAYSMIGETTPRTFYESLTPSMMEDGFLSRFLIVEYSGERPASNPNVGAPMPPELKQSISALCSQAIANNSRHHVEPVVCDNHARELLHKFDIECDDQINANDDEGIRQMWNRAHLKVCRIAAILAVCDNWTQPVIRTEHVEWALTVVKKDIATMFSRIENGDIGLGDDSSRMAKMRQIVLEYFAGKKRIPDSYNVDPAMRDVGVVPYRYIQLRCMQLQQFRGCRGGARAAVDGALKMMIDSGYLIELDKNRIQEQFGTTGRAFRLAAKL